MEEPGRFHDATLVRIRQLVRSGGAALPVADEKGRTRRMGKHKLAQVSGFRDQETEIGNSKINT